MAVLLGLLFAAAIALRGQMPERGPQPRDPAAESPASLAGMIALLGVSFVVMAFAMFARRPAKPKAAAWEIPDFDRAGPARLNIRLVLIGLGFLVMLLVAFLVASQIRIGADLSQQPPAPTTSVPDSQQAQPASTAGPKRPHSDTYRLLALSTVGLLALMTVATVITALRNRTSPPAIVVNSGPPADGQAGPEPLAVAAERGLAEVANLGLEPREAIIACYAAMEQALAGAPGAAPQASDTPSEVLARAVGNRSISAGSAAPLVELFAEARFSRHTMTEDHREQAERALRSVLGELRSLRSSA